MRFTSAFIAAFLPAAFAAQQQQVLAHSTSMKVEDAPGSMASMPVLVNSTDSLPQTPNPLTTTAPQKPALEASVMGLIVFSAAGLYLFMMVMREWFGMIWKCITVDGGVQVKVFAFYTQVLSASF
ncbi:hypothetical protein AAE478_006147 [Parahypoxylon ruwenzoriense]